MSTYKKHCLYCYTVKNAITNEETALKVGITTLRNNIRDIYRAVETRIMQQQVHNIESNNNETFLPGRIFFCICLDEDDPNYDIKTFGYLTNELERDETYFRRRCRYYEKTIHQFLTRHGFHRDDMYRSRIVDGNIQRLTEFFFMQNSRNLSIFEAMDIILGNDRLNINVNAHRWQLCIGCNDYARDEEGQICDVCGITWCHDECMPRYYSRHNNVTFDNIQECFKCHRCNRIRSNRR
jgi:hypothetical protein